MDEREKAYAYWLNSAPGIGLKNIRKLKSRCGCLEEVYRAGEKLYRSLLSEKKADGLAAFTSGWDVEGEYAGLAGAGVKFVTVDEPEYPGRLRDIPDPPYGLFWKGVLPDHSRLAAAVIGARDCSEYGRYVAAELGKALGENGVQVISGMARGIDGISQQAALDAGGTSFAVLGCGVDICYPAQNRGIYDRLLERGGILSPYPPGTEPQPNLFPPRNRIVSGLADAVVVVEARVRSGTLITVDMALEQGREVYAVPGRLTDRLSDGCNRLLNQGAAALLSPKEFIADLMGLFPRKFPDADAASSGCGEGGPSTVLNAGILHAGGLTEQERKVWSCLDYCPQSVEQVRSRLGDGFSYPETLQILMRLCLSGAARQIGTGYFLKKAP